LIRLKSINANTEIVCTPKFDGLSLCNDEVNTGTWTRGDGVYGQKSDEHYKLIQNHLYEDIYENGDPLVLLISRILMARLLCQEMYF
jgi:NAD-dependent DNA ligase